MTRSNRIIKDLVSVLVAVVVLPVVGGLERVAVAVPPPAPTLLSPADGGSVTIPTTISWSQVAGAGGYNWEVSLSPGFTSVIERSPALLVGAATTQDVVSGLANGTYFWHVQAVSPAVEPGAWSTPRSFTITGAGAGVPGTATLNPPLNATQFHSWENITFTWSAVPGAVGYVLQESTGPTFPVDTRVRQVGIPGPTAVVSFNPSIQGNFQARVIAVGADGLMGSPSNLVGFSVLDSNPFPAPPTLVAPTNGTSQQLPVRLSWSQVPNHQDLGYQVQIATDSSFTSIEATYQITENSKIVSSLTTGTKFWRVRSQHGYIGSVQAYTAFSATGSFTVLATTLRMGAVTFPATKFSGGEASGTLELTGAAPAAGATVTLTASDPNLLPELPSSRQIPAGTSSIQVLVAPTGFPNSLRPMRVGFVTTATPVTITATYSGSSVSTTIMILPPQLNDTPFQLFPQKATGGADMLGIVDLEVGCFAGLCDGLAPPGGFLVNLSSSSPSATVPATMTIPSGAGGDQFPIRTTPVTKLTIATITARAGGVTANWQITLTPSPAPDTFTLDPVDTVSGSRGIIRIPLASILGHDQLVQVTSSNPQVASVPSFATISASTDFASFAITTSAVTTRTVVTITATGGGVTRSADLVVHPSLPTLTGFTVNPTSVQGGTSATGTVTLDSPSPTGGLAVNLGSSLPGAASVPATVTIPAGAISASFAVTTFAVANTTAQLTATLSTTTLFAALSITAAPSIALTSLTLSPTTVVGGVSSIGTVSLSAAAPTGGAVVSLSGNSAAASEPATVTVPAGSTSTTFAITTSAVSSATAVTISGSFGGASASATLTVNPPSAATLSALGVSPTSVVGGASSTATITLTAAAPAGGAVVTLASSSAAAAIPASATVVAGATSATFPVTTSTVATATAVTLTATYSGVSRTAILTVNPAATSSLPAPSLLSPAVDARFSPGQTIVFDWSDVAGAARYTIQIASQDTFSSPTVNTTVSASIYLASTLPITRMWWRVRAIDASGRPGAWSEARRFEVKQ